MHRYWRTPCLIKTIQTRIVHSSEFHATRKRKMKLKLKISSSITTVSRPNTICKYIKLNEQYIIPCLQFEEDRVLPDYYPEDEELEVEDEEPDEDREKKDDSNSGK